MGLAADESDLLVPDVSCSGPAPSADPVTAIGATAVEGVCYTGSIAGPLDADTAGRLPPPPWCLPASRSAPGPAPSPREFLPSPLFRASVERPYVLHAGVSLGGNIMKKTLTTLLTLALLAIAPSAATASHTECDEPQYVATTTITISVTAAEQPELLLPTDYTFEVFEKSCGAYQLEEVDGTSELYFFVSASHYEDNDPENVYAPVYDPLFASGLLNDLVHVTGSIKGHQVSALGTYSLDEQGFHTDFGYASMTGTTQ